MSTPWEIKQAILQLSAIERESIARWLSDYTDSYRTVAEPALAYGADQVPRLLTADEYLESEETAAVRHEYVAGVLYAMGGCSTAHNLIALNLVTAFHALLRGGTCQAYMSDIKLRLKAGQGDIFYYPDIMVACGQQGTSEVYLEHPKLIIEVLSPSTERIDRREKALYYREITTLEEYILVAQDRPLLEIQRRADDWLPIAITSLYAIVEFRSIGLNMPLQQIYEDVPNTRTPVPT